MRKIIYFIEYILIKILFFIFKLIGYKFVKDHYGRDVEEVFQNTGKFMKQEIIDTYNNCDTIKQ